jgi:hypothetical protein
LESVYCQRLTEYPFVQIVLPRSYDTTLGASVVKDIRRGGLSELLVQSVFGTEKKIVPIIAVMGNKMSDYVNLADKKSAISHIHKRGLLCYNDPPTQRKARKKEWYRVFIGIFVGKDSSSS